MKKYAIEIKWAVIFFAVSLLWMLIEKMAGWHGPRIDLHPYLTNLFAIPAIAVYVFAIREKRNLDYNGIMTWKQGFIAGLIITVVVALMSPLNQAITHLYLSPEYFPNAIEFSLQKNPDMTREEAEAFFTLKSYIMQGTIGALLMGVITSAFVSIFLKKKAD